MISVTQVIGTIVILGTVGVMPSTPASPATELSLHVSSLPGDSLTPIRFIASGGRIASGDTWRAVGRDTVRARTSLDFRTGEVVGIATVLVDHPKKYVHVVVKVGDDIVSEGTGEMIIVSRTPMGAQLIVTPIPVELQARP